MPRKSRSASKAARPVSSRDVPGAMYCDPRYGADDGDVPGTADTDPDDFDPDAAEPASDAPALASGADEIVGQLRGWVPLAARSRRSRGRPSAVTDAAITEAVESTNGNISRAAALLGMTPRALQWRVRDGRVVWPEGVPRRYFTGSDAWVGSSRVPVAEVWAAWRKYGNVVRTAEAVGLDRSTLQRFLRRNGVGPLPHPWARPKETAPPEEPQGAPTTDAVSCAGSEADAPGTPPGPTGAPPAG